MSRDCLEWSFDSESGKALADMVKKVETAANAIYDDWDIRLKLATAGVNDVLSLGQDVFIEGQSPMQVACEVHARYIGDFDFKTRKNTRDGVIYVDSLDVEEIGAYIMHVFPAMMSMIAEAWVKDEQGGERPLLLSDASDYTVIARNNLPKEWYQEE